MVAMLGQLGRRGSSVVPAEDCATGIDPDTDADPEGRGRAAELLNSPWQWWQRKNLR